ncbi:UNVERIFIED_CONTAM: hypothetical protein PYX00_011399 [Menopon gallinae]|uniref:Helicase ATP-binding domain-containing protein n=1 Tax=Menopon gallinae TaxID=328185 RepID=A0AAW2H7F1_9NEOP
MVRLKINGLSVDFPYQPYPAQIASISKIAMALQEGGTAIVESPTGTGKSLSILCAALAYIESLNAVKQTVPRIYICSRTHKQLDQLVEQLRKTSYRPRISILASRNQYCIMPTLKNEADKTAGCSDLVKSGGCIYYNGKDKLVRRMADRLFDIEEMRREGRKCGGCPYYSSRLLCDKSEIVFAPYNYLIDTGIRESMSINLKNTVVIIDEAHNIEDCCRSSGSIELTSKVLEICISELLNIARVSSNCRDDYFKLANMFKRLKDYGESEVEFNKSDLFENVRVIKRESIAKEIHKMNIDESDLSAFNNAYYSILNDEDEKETVSSLHICRNLLLIFRKIVLEQCQSYGFALVKRKADKENYGNKRRMLAAFSINFWLLDPSVIFKPIISEVKSLVLLSGTLTPFSASTRELGHDFRGHLGKEILGTYAQSETHGYLDQVADIIADVSTKLGRRGGTLVFLPSYSFLEKISRRLKIAFFCEPKSSEFENVLRQYNKSIVEHKPSVLLCVYRGKAAEGIDFRDACARAVLAVGIPYPNLKDIQVELKREYSDRSWYETQAFRAVSQALGRVIRHKDDWGAVFLLDTRYSSRRIIDSLSRWVRENVKHYDRYLEAKADFEQFLSSH